MDTKPKVRDILFTDTETFSELDIKKVGTVKYAESAELTLAGFKLDDKYSVYDYSDGSLIPDWVHKHIDNGGWVAAHNALFDYLVLKPYFINLKLEQVIDTQAIVAAHGLPLSLEKSGAALGLPLDKQKLKDGKRLVTKFCSPRKPSKNNPSTRWTPQDAPKDWAIFRDEYLRLDIEAMIEIYSRLGPLSPEEHTYWLDTQKINLRGLPVDIETTQYIIDKLDQLVDVEASKFIRIVGLFPTQRDKVLQWVRDQGVNITDLQAATVEAAINNSNTPEHVREALITRANTTHMSFKKFPVIMAAAMDDQTVKGTLMYHVAHTGRFGGRLLQPQNLTKGNIDGVEAVKRIQSGEFNVDLVKSAVRPMIYTPEGFTIVDWSSVEARGVQWVCRDEEALKVFRPGNDPYIWMATKIYGVLYERVTDKQRFTGKQAILGLGYQMSAKKFVSMVENYGETISMDEAKLAVDVYRKTHQKLVRFWKQIEQGALLATVRQDHLVKVNKYVGFLKEERFLYMILPSGRRIAYYLPQIENGTWGNTISYMGMNEKNQYVRTHTYGGKLTENLVQGLCRDLLVFTVHNLLEAGYDVVTHIHDEIVIAGTYDVKEIEDKICELPPWAEGLPLAAEGFNSPRFKKG